MVYTRRSVAPVVAARQHTGHTRSISPVQIAVQRTDKKRIAHEHSTKYTLATRQVPYAPLLKQTHQYSLRGAIHVHQTPKNLRPEVKTPQHSTRDISQRNGRPCRTSRPGCVYCSSTHHLDTPPTSIESPSHDTHTRQHRLQPRYMNVTYK